MSDIQTQIHVREGQYQDPRTNTDKFFRVFVWGSSWATHYGRNNGSSTITAVVTAASPEAAQKAADAKWSSKVKGGYNPERDGLAVVDVEITDQNRSFLADVAELVPHIADQDPSAATAQRVSVPVVTVSLDGAVPDDRTAEVVLALDARVHGRPVAREDVAPTLGVRPMLASVQPADVVDAAMVTDEWIAQFKYDGERVVIDVTDGEIRVLNRAGQEKAKSVATAQLETFRVLQQGRWVFDGELVGRVLVLFDLLVATDGATTWASESSSFEVRSLVLSVIAETLGIPFASADEDQSVPVVLAPSAVGASDKADLLSAAVVLQREGIVLRHREGAYESGRRSTLLVKHKLIKDADVFVSSGHDHKQSVELSVNDAQGNPVVVGAASTIGRGDVSIGDVWIVTFLYVVDPRYPRMVQPRLVRKRTDKTASECSIEQFADAGTAKIV